MRTLRLGTRGSALARAQAGHVAALLREKHPGLEVELKVIMTSGDRFSLAAVSMAAAPAESRDGAPNVKAMFVKEIEQALLNGEIDLAVHSAKDLPVELPEGLAIGAYPVREDPRDVFVGREGRLLKDLIPGSVVGTAALRRRIQLGRHRTDLIMEELRGNVDTRLKKLESGRYDGIVLAAAGLKRLGLDVPCEPIPADIVVPAPGQGALAVETRSEGGEVRDLISSIDDERTRLEVGIERRFLQAVGGGCATPLGALATTDGDGVRLAVFWSEEDGRRAQRIEGRSGLRPEELDSMVKGLRCRLDPERVGP